MKKSISNIALFLLLIWANLTSAQDFTRVFSSGASLLYRDVVTIQVADYDKTTVLYWKNNYIRFEISVQVTEDRVKFLDDIEMRYSPTIDTAGRLMNIRFDRLDEIVMINRRYWKDDVHITVYLPEKTNKMIFFEDMKRREDLVQNEGKKESKSY
jgi:hypothetical protein